MTRIVVEGPISLQLKYANDLVEIWNIDGQLLGHFRPIFDIADYEGTECPVPEEELKRRIEEGGGRSLREILADLEKRTS